MLYEDGLYHYGIKGMKWGVHRSSDNKNYKSKGIRAKIARKSNDKVDASFKNWGENTKKKENTIDLGKKANEKKMAYEKDRSNKSLKKDFKNADKAYKKALKSNTTYRKGDIKKAVGQDLSRKYLSEAKKTKKQLDANPGDKALKKQYDDFMSKHDVERAKARRAPEVAANRSRKIASIKRSMTMTVKATATTAAVGAGLYAANRYLDNHQVTLNGKKVQFNKQNVADVMKMANAVKNIMKFI